MSVQIGWIHSTLNPSLSVEGTMIDSAYSIESNSDWATLLFQGIFRGPVQIYLCSDEYIGLCFIAAIAICNWRAALLCLWGSTVGTLFAILVGVDTDRVSFGLHSYNAALTMMGIGCIFAKLSIKNLAMAFNHSIFCVMLELACLTVMAPSGMPYLTLPFCISTMLFSVFAFRKKQESKRKQRQVENQTTSGLSRLQSIRGAPIILDDIDSGSDNTWGTGRTSIMKTQKRIETRGAPTVLDDILNE